VLVRRGGARLAPLSALGKDEADLRREYRELSDAPGATPGALSVRAGIVCSGCERGVAGSDGLCDDCRAV
jgi:hypothetical protein